MGVPGETKAGIIVHSAGDAGANFGRVDSQGISEGCQSISGGIFPPSHTQALARVFGSKCPDSDIIFDQSSGMNGFPRTRKRPMEVVFPGWVRITVSEVPQSVLITNRVWSSFRT